MSSCEGCQRIISQIIHFQVADEIWICEKETVTKWEGDILQYKEHLKNKVMKELRRAEKAAMQQQNGGGKAKDSSERGKW